jgi:23S rRNA (pseudouridine1915-N3)-methyltransferase
MSLNIQIRAIGKFGKKDPLQLCIDEYRKRMKWSVNIFEHEIKAQILGNLRQEQEAKWLLSNHPERSVLVALDERGQNWSSEKFAAQIGAWQQQTSNIVFIIGGADGLTDQVRAQSKLILSFGAMTWPHRLVRTLLVEQLYRSYTILQGHPYHRS